jgi:ABC-type nitrate/sulfonate/bicarbonate transport system permease component
MTEQTKPATAPSAKTDLSARPVPLRARGFQPRPRRWAAVLGFAVIIGGWELASSVGWLSPVIMPSPLDVLRALWTFFATGEIWPHLGASLGRILWGWTLGTLAGLVLGVSVGMFSVARAVGLPIVSAFFPIPKIALLPLFIVWFGIGEPSKVAVILFGVFFPTVIATYSAVDNVPRSLIRMAQSFNLPHRHIVLKIILPGALPGILAGFRISSAIALILLVAAEMIGPEYGLGALVLQAGNLMQTDQLLAGVIILSALGLTIAYLLGRIEKRLLRWR